MISTFFLFFHSQIHLFTVRSQLTKAIICSCVSIRELPVARPM
jgi:hypothetical protein